MGVFRAVSVAAVESLRSSLAAPWAPVGTPHVIVWPEVRVHEHPTHVGDQEGSHGASRQAKTARVRSCGGVLVVVRGGVRGHHRHDHRGLPRRLGAADGCHPWPTLGCVLSVSRAALERLVGGARPWWAVVAAGGAWEAWLVTATVRQMRQKSACFLVAFVAPFSDPLGCP